MAALAAAPLAISSSAQAVKIDEKLPTYAPVEGVSGSIKSVGSDTCNELMALWAEGFKTLYPNVQIEIEGKGSTTAPPALVAGTATFGPMSRPMKYEEKDGFEKAFGYKPTELAVCIDMLGVYVHKDNPLKSLTLAQADAIFSSTRKGGLKDDIRTWGQLGLTGDWTNQPISLYGRNSASGTYGYFKEHALFKGDFKSSVKEQPGSSAVIQGIASDRWAIGYSGIGYKTADVRTVPLSKDGKAFIDATVEHAYDGTYPLSRFLYVYLNRKPNEALDPLRREFIRYVYSKQGQEQVVKAGFFPLLAPLSEKGLATVGLSSKRVLEAGSAKN
jgi:phosphate transport system substrate-binding protein